MWTSAIVGFPVVCTHNLSLFQPFVLMWATSPLNELLVKFCNADQWILCLSLRKIWTDYSVKAICNTCTFFFETAAITDLLGMWRRTMSTWTKKCCEYNQNGRGKLLKIHQNSFVAGEILIFWLEGFYSLSQGWCWTCINCIVDV